MSRVAFVLVALSSLVAGCTSAGLPPSPAQVAPAAAPAPQLATLFGFDGSETRRDPLFDCTKGELCKTVVPAFGGFALRRSQAEFGSGRLDRLSLWLNASEAAVRAWLIARHGAPTGHGFEGKTMVWTIGDRSIELVKLDQASLISLRFRDVPPLPPMACAGDDYYDWFDATPPVVVADRGRAGEGVMQEDEDEHC